MTYTPELLKPFTLARAEDLNAELTKIGNAIQEAKDAQNLAYARFFGTFDEAVDQMEVGEYFTCAASGVLSTYKRVSSNPLHETMPESTWPVSRASLISLDPEGGAGIPAYDVEVPYNDGTVGKKLQQIKAVGDYATHAIAQAAAVATGVAALFVAEPAVSSIASKAGVVVNHHGDDQVTLADGHKLGKQFSKVTAQPAAYGSWDSIETAFDGDLSQSLFQHEHHIESGALAVPSTGYRYTPEAAARTGYLFNQAGGNTSLTGNGGRTSANYLYLKVDQYGGGDAACISASGLCAGAGPAGVTHWLAMPATVALNGTHTAAVHGVYLNFIECDLVLENFDAAAIGMVTNIKRNIGDTAGGLGAYTSGFRAQSTGTYAVDAGLSGGGLFKTFIDGTPVTLTTANALMTMRAGQRIYGNALSTDGLKATSYGLEWIECSPLGFWNVIFNNTSCLQINHTRVQFISPPRLPEVSTSQLPGASPDFKGTEYYVTDANTTVRFATIIGGGTSYVKVFCTGTQWLVA